MIYLKSGNTYYALSVVQSYSRALSSTVSAIPVGNGSTISDHITNNNKSFNYSGYIAFVDFYNATGSYPTLEQARKPYNTSYANINADYSVTSPAGYIANKNGRSVRAALEAVRDAKELVSIILWDSKNNRIDQILENYAITSITFSEDEGTGDGVNVAISLEEVRVVMVVQTNVKVSAEALVKPSTSKSGNDNPDDPNKKNRDDLAKLTSDLNQYINPEQSTLLNTANMAKKLWGK